MTPEQAISVIEMYEKRLRLAGIPKIRLEVQRTIGSATNAELLAHAHYLCDEAKVYFRDPGKQRKAGSHLTAIQMCLSFVGWYTLEDLLIHDRS